MKVAFVHDFLNEYGGAERVVEAMHEVFPDAPIFTTLYEPSSLPDSFPKHKVQQINFFKNPFLKIFSKQITPFYPIAIESIDLENYGIIVSSTAGFAKGLVTKKDQVHICYCHTPPRFLYKYEGESSRRMAWYYAPAVTLLDSLFRIWDYAAAQRVTFFLTNSHNTAERIRKFYRRHAEVLYPPVSFVPKEIENQKKESQNHNDYFLVVSRFSAYKHVELAIEACNRLGKKLIVVGKGKEEKKLKSVAGATISFLGFVSDVELANLYKNAQALIYTPMDEDFGISPLEAISFGCPVIGHRSGGTKETILEGKTGEFFDEYSVEALILLLKSFERSKYNLTDLSKQVDRFSKEIFQEKFRELINKSINLNSERKEDTLY